jgi:hypothetical protein
MSIGSLFTFIVIAIFVISAIKRAMETASQGAQKRQQQGRDAEASPTEVEEFLRSLQHARRQLEQAGQQRPGAPAAPVAQATPPPARLEEEVLLWQAPAVAAVRTRQPAAPAVRPKRVRRQPKPTDDDVVETLVATEPVKESPPPAPPPAAVAPPALKKVGLREAVIWSEILGPPLSVRRRRGHAAKGGHP